MHNYTLKILAGELYNQRSSLAHGSFRNFKQCVQDALQFHHTVFLGEMAFIVFGDNRSPKLVAEGAALIERHDIIVN